MNTTIRRLALLTLMIAFTACSSPLAAPEAGVDDGAEQRNTTAADSSASRGGGNLMGGN